MASKSEHLQDLVLRYREAGQPWPAKTRDVAKWALETKNWAPHPFAILNQCAEEISRALRDEYALDEQGRKVRTKHVATYVDGDDQYALWDDIKTASPQHMRLAFQQRRQQIVGDCKQLKNDVDSYNENRSPITPIQVVFNFELDLEEYELERHRYFKKAA